MDGYTQDMTDLVARPVDERFANKSAVARVVTGLILALVFWAISWLQVRPASDFYFFPLWLGYILTVDGLVAVRTGTSPIERNGWRVAWLFAVSVPLWWIFEGFNVVVDNWRYQTPIRYSSLEYALLASVAFSTVVPAVLTTTELVRSFRLDPLRRLPPIQPTRAFLLSIHGAGWLMVTLTMFRPEAFFPFVWLSLVFVLDPVVHWLGGRSLVSFVSRRDWSPLFNLAVGTLICGWFWEMWNLYSMPKWTYNVPYGEYLHVFEMPLLGFGGYIPFGYEVYLLSVLVGQVAPWLKVPETPVSSRSD